MVVHRHAFKRKKKVNKYGNTKVKRDGYTFDSQAEARYYDNLKLRRLGGDIVFFLCQVPMRLGGGIVYRVDFLEFHTDGTVHFIDVKGVETTEFAIKKKLVEHQYPLEIEIVKSKSI